MKIRIVRNVFWDSALVNKTFGFLNFFIIFNDKYGCPMPQITALDKFHSKKNLNVVI